ncbi:MAG: TonB-dependent receptor plug domain-containing protein, partial [Vicingaceae bacterium]|nr:TonB-dependent receptor plug domain-containing protein [Vicingaceae bacterium]
MGKNYNVQFSFNDQLLAECFISDNKTYDSPKKAITELVKNCQLTFKINEGVFVIYKPTIRKEITYRKTLKGIIVDAVNGEALPYSNIQINDIDITTDGKGNFSFKSQDSIFHIKVSHVGYYIKDTIIHKGSILYIKLNPCVVGLEEFVVSSNADIQIATVGERSGLVKVNSKVAQFLPGNRSNTIFNILRLQPGVLAAGEQTNDYLLWGSYKGQTQIIFDGITLFNIGSTNDNIGAINPFITKDIEVYKGGYNAQLGDRTGGVVNITGSMGQYEKFGTQVSIDNQLTNGSVNVPLGKKNVFQLMFRKSYFDKMDFKNDKKYDNSYTIDQQFTDVNIKLSGFGDNGDQYYISLLGNKDDVAYDVKTKQDDLLSSYHKSYQEQRGGSVYYSKSWKNVGNTNFTIAHSNLNINSSDSRQYIDSLNINKPTLLNSIVTNGVSENSIKIEHHFPTFHRQTWLLGMGLINNKTTFDDETKLAETNTNRINGFLKNDISVSKKISIEPGLSMKSWKMMFY